MARHSYTTPSPSVATPKAEVIEEVILDHKEAMRAKVKAGKAPADLFEDMFGEQP